MTADDLLGTVEPGDADALVEGDDPHDDTPAPGDEPTPSPQTPAGDTESFIDPATLPPEIKPHWKRMHGAYTRRMQELKSAREAAALVERFNTDPQYALQVIQQRAAQLGLSLPGPGQTAAPPRPSSEATPTTGDEPPPGLIESMRAEIPQEMQWMAPMMAKMFWQANKQQLGPVLERLARQEEQVASQTKEQATREYEAAEAEMDERYPVWRDHERDLVELTQFLRSDRMTHPKYGNKLELVYRALKAEDLGTATATQRMSQAAKNRVTTGTPARTSQANIEERIRSAKSMREAMEIAARASAEQLGLR